MLTLTAIAPIVRPRQDDRCLASLLLWASPWSDIAIILTSTLIFLYIVLGLTLTVQLVRTVKLEREERIAASRIVYYLAVGVAVFVSEPNRPRLFRSFADIIFEELYASILDTEHIIDGHHDLVPDGSNRFEHIRYRQHVYAPSLTLKRR